MNHQQIRLAAEKQIGNEIYQLLEGDIIEQIIREAKVQEIENEWKYILEGHSFKISPQLTPKLFTIIQEVITKLKFEEPIDFYISNSAEFNAYAIYRNADNLNHTICINSSLIANMTESELKFIIGHEIGHLISNNARLMKLIQFVYSDMAKMPLLLRNKFDLWYKLSELTADRFGYLASPNINECISGFFKLSSGLNVEKINFNINAYLEEIEMTLKYFRENNIHSKTSHPINALRIKSILLFSDEEIQNKLEQDNSINVDNLLGNSFDELLSFLTILGNSELEYHRKFFIATAGLILAGLDDDFANKEYETILAVLANLTIFPQQFLESIIKQGNVEEIFNSSIENILQQNPGERFEMLNYLISMTLADQKIMQKEISFIYLIGEKAFGLTRKEVAQIFAERIQRDFYPNVYKN